MSKLVEIFCDVDNFFAYLFHNGGKQSIHDGHTSGSAHVL